MTFRLFLQLLLDNLSAKSCLTLAFTYPYPLPFFSQGPPEELLQKRLQTDATWHDLKILTEPQGWPRYEKDLWNARSIDRRLEKMQKKEFFFSRAEGSESTLKLTFCSLHGQTSRLRVLQRG